MAELVADPPPQSSDAMSAASRPSTHASTATAVNVAVRCCIVSVTACLYARRNRRMPHDGSCGRGCRIIRCWLYRFRFGLCPPSGRALLVPLSLVHVPSKLGKDCPRGASPCVDRASSSWEIDFLYWSNWAFRTSSARSQSSGSGWGRPHWGNDIRKPGKLPYRRDTAPACGKNQWPPSGAVSCER